MYVNSTQFIISGNSCDVVSFFIFTEELLDHCMFQLTLVFSSHT